MKTIIAEANQQIYELAASLLRSGEIVAFPTETVYGLGASIQNELAIQKIYSTKGRPSDNPLIAHISSLDQVQTIAQSVPDIFFTLADTFFPGPLTLVVKKADSVPLVATANLSTIGIRMPNHPIALELIHSVKSPLVAPSANLSGRPSPTRAQHVYEDLQDKIPLIIDGGPCTIGIESTVLDLTVTPYTILRPGHITKLQVESVLKQPIVYATDKSEIKSPGMKYKHYSPNTPITLVESVDDIPMKNSIVLTNTIRQSETRDVVPLNENTLYSIFRIADSHKYSHIYIHVDASVKSNAGLMNRIRKAAGLL